MNKVETYEFNLPKGKYYIGGVDDVLTNCRDYQTAFSQSEFSNSPSILNVNGAGIYYIPFTRSTGSAQQHSVGKLSKPEEIEIITGEWHNLCFLNVDDYRKLNGELDQELLRYNPIVEFSTDQVLRVEMGEPDESEFNYKATIKSEGFDAEFTCQIYL